MQQRPGALNPEERINRALNDQALALGALFQCTVLVHDIASRGRCATEPLGACLGAVLDLDPVSVAAVYPEPGQLAGGLRYLAELLRGRASRPEPLRLGIAVMRLERQFLRRTEAQQALGRELRLIGGTGGAHDNPAGAETVSQLADAWVQHIGGTEPRIMVSGLPQYLQDRDNQSLIRALLLGALRAVFLWRQVGGNRWQLLFRRRAYSAAVGALLAA